MDVVQAFSFAVRILRLGLLSHASQRPVAFGDELMVPSFGLISHQHPDPTATPCSTAGPAAAPGDENIHNVFA